MNAAAWAPWTAAAVGVQVGAAIVATRFVVGELGPATLAGLRYAIGLATLLPFVLAAREPATITPREWPRIALLGIGQFALLIALLNIGLQTLPAAKAALLFACFPLLTLLVAAALGHERLSLRKSLGVACRARQRAVRRRLQRVVPPGAAPPCGPDGERDRDGGGGALPLGSLLLHEPLAPALIVALLLVVLGLWVAQDRRP